MEHERETQRANAVLWSKRGAHWGTHIRGEDRLRDRRVDGFWQTDSWSKTPPHPTAPCLLSLSLPLSVFELGPSLTICWLTGSRTRGVDGSEEERKREERRRWKDRIREGCKFGYREPLCLEQHRKQCVKKTLHHFSFSETTVVVVLRISVKWFRKVKSANTAHCQTKESSS